MGSFDAGDGAIHLLFAEEDDYYTDSLIRMDLQQYLDYRLRKSKYEYIYFFRETGRVKGMFGSAEGVTAECLDSKSADRYPTDIFQYMMPSRVSVQHLSRGKTCRHQFAGRREDAALRILNLMEEPCAFVMPLSLMQSLLELDMFSKRLPDKLQGKFRKSIFLLTASHQAEDSVEALRQLARTAPNLFPEIVQMQNSREKLSFFRQLKNKYQDRMEVWNQGDQKTIVPMLRRLQIKGEYKGKGGTITDYAQLLSDCEERAQTGIHPLFEQDPGHSLKKLREALAEEGAWSRLNELRKEDSLNNIPHTGKLRFPVYQMRPELENLIRAMDRESQAFHIFWGEELEDLRSRIVTEMTTPWCKETSYEGVGEEMVVCTGRLERDRRQHRKHPDLIRYSPAAALLRDIWYRVCQPDRYSPDPEIFRKKTDIYQGMIRVSEQIMELLKSFDRNMQEIENITSQLEKTRSRRNALAKDIEEELRINSQFISKEKNQIMAWDSHIEVLTGNIDKYSKTNALILDQIRSRMKAIDTANSSIMHVIEDDSEELLRSIEMLATITGTDGGMYGI